MPQVGRNDPCPCGSGQKYKKCCLAKDDAQAHLSERAHRTEVGALRAAIDCLEAHDPFPVDQLIYEDLLGPVRAKYGDLWRDANPATFLILERHLPEWAVVEGMLVSEENVRLRALDLVLQSSQAEALLRPEEQAWLAELGRRPLSLFEVGSTVAARQIELRDCLSAVSEPILAHHWRMHEIVKPGDYCIARVVQYDGEWYVTTSALPFHVRELARGLAQAFSEQDLASRLPANLNAEDAAFLTRRVRTRYLLQSWVEERLALDPAVLPAVGRRVGAGVFGAQVRSSASDAPPQGADVDLEWLEERLKAVMEHSAPTAGSARAAGPGSRVGDRRGHPGGHRGGHRRGTWVTDLRHFLDESGRLAAQLTGEGRGIAEHVAHIVAVTSVAMGEELIETGVRCRRRPDRVPCTGTIRASLAAESDQIWWDCPACADHGVVSGWRGTLWDRSKTRPVVTAGEPLRARTEGA